MVVIFDSIVICQSVTKTCYYSRILWVFIVINCLTKKGRNREKEITISKMYNQS